MTKQRDSGNLKLVKQDTDTRSANDRKLEERRQHNMDVLLRAFKDHLDRQKGQG